MGKKLRIVLAQLNLTVGDIDGNLEKSIDAAHKARDTHKADIIVYPELSLTGYPPEDLLLRKSFLNATNEALNQFKERVKDIHCLVGHPYATSQGLYNSCSLIYNGTILARYSKQHLPNYGVFDEYRYFVSNTSPCVVPINGTPVGLLICEDIWFPGPIHQTTVQGARLILVPNASPFESNKHEQRLAVLQKCAKSANAPIVYVNCVGGQDELVFDGGSLVVDQTGKPCQFAGFFNETLLPVDIDISSAETNVTIDAFAVPPEEKRIYDCLVLGVRDYVQKNGFKSAMVGISGGIDSALTLTIAVDALGKENVHAVYMPSRYSADISGIDAKALADNVGVNFQSISIEPVYTEFLKSLTPSFIHLTLAITEQNIQSRCRMIILMALSNQFGHLVLTTGNRSEMAVGYATLYGDMAGALAVLKDVPKLLVYRLARYRNHLSPVIPERTIERIPTAELAPNQTDQDTLPPYEILDAIIELYMNQSCGADEIIDKGFDKETVHKVVNMIKRSEYKRRQSATGIDINQKSFGRDWRYPITSRFKM